MRDERNMHAPTSALDIILVATAIAAGLVLLAVVRVLRRLAAAAVAAAALAAAAAQREEAADHEAGYRGAGDQLAAVLADLATPVRELAEPPAQQLHGAR